MISVEETLRAPCFPFFPSPFDCHLHLNCILSVSRSSFTIDPVKHSVLTFRIRLWTHDLTPTPRSTSLSTLPYPVFDASVNPAQRLDLLSSTHLSPFRVSDPIPFRNIVISISCSLLCAPVALTLTSRAPVVAPLLEQMLTSVLTSSSIVLSSRRLRCLTPYSLLHTPFDSTRRRPWIPCSTRFLL